MSSHPHVRPRNDWLRTDEGGNERAHPAGVGGRQNRVHRLELCAADAADVHRFVARRVGNLADAADIAQQTLLQACAKLGTCRGGNLSAWLLTIARHLIVDHYRARNRFRFLEVAALAETEPALRTPPDAVLAVCERRERLNSWLNCLTRRLRLEEQVAVLLADVHGHFDKDSAAVLRMSVPSFKLLLHGARVRLHEIAGGNCMLVRKKSAAACDESDCDGHGSKSGKEPPSVHLTYRVGVTCRLGAPKLLALRRKLLEGLACLILALVQVSEDLVAFFL